MNMRNATVAILSLVLVSCGSEPEGTEKKPDYALFDDAAVKALFDAGDFPKVEEIIRAQYRLGISDKTDHLLQADMYILQFKGVAAEVAVGKAKEFGAEDNETALRLARAFVIQREFIRALEAIGSTVLVGNDAYDALLLRGDIHRELNDAEIARDFFITAIADQPENFKGYLGLALLELNLGNLAEAEKQAELASAYVEDDPIVRYVRGTAARYQLRTDEAIIHLSKAIELHPAHILANLELAGIYIDKDEIEKAQGHLDFVYGISPDNAMAKYYTALILATEGKTSEAEDVLLRVGDLTREFPPAARVYGHVAFKLEKFTKAAPYLKRFLDLVPADRITRWP